MKTRIYATPAVTGLIESQLLGMELVFKQQDLQMFGKKFNKNG